MKREHNRINSEKSKKGTNNTSDNKLGELVEKIDPVDQLTKIPGMYIKRTHCYKNHKLELLKESPYKLYLTEKSSHFILRQAYCNGCRKKIKKKFETFGHCKKCKHD